MVIGKGGRNIDEHNAMDHVAGFCVINDVSEREWQLERGGTWDKGKGFDTFGPLGPWLVTRDEISDPHQLDLWLEVDGQRYQNGNTRTMVKRPAIKQAAQRCDHAFGTIGGNFYVSSQADRKSVV